MAEGKKLSLKWMGMVGEGKDGKVYGREGYGRKGVW